MSEKNQVEVNDENFQEKVIKTSEKIPVVVDFWADWCYPCHILSPIIEKLAKEYKGKFILAKLNVNQNPKTTEEYLIMSIPNVKMFKNGKVVDEFVGALPEFEVRKWLDKNL
jgi:putative thioredoxin